MQTEGFGSRGEWWVVGQAFLMPAAAAIAWWSRFPGGWPGAFHLAGVAAGLICLAVAVALVAGGLVKLGSNLAVVPKPIEQGSLVQGGVYGLVRHPIYAGIIFGVLGWSLALNSLAGLAMSGAMLAFFDLKSRREEVWLARKYPEYAAYRARVRKLIPCLY